jgi:ATP-dependent DNA helicase RecG
MQELSARQKEIIFLLTKTNTMTANEIRKLLKEPPAQRTLRDDLSNLKKMGLIDTTGHAKTAIWFLNIH